MIIAEENLKADKIKIDLFSYDISKWTESIRENLRLLSGSSQAVSRATEIAIYTELAEVENDEFKRRFGQIWDDWRRGRPTLNIEAILDEADELYERIKKRGKWKVGKAEEKEISEVVALKTELQEMRAFMASFKSNNNNQTEKSEANADKKKASKIFWNQKPKPGEPTEKLTFKGNKVWWCDSCRNGKGCFQWKHDDKPGAHEKWSQEKQNKETGEQSTPSANQATITWDF